jgi:RimJ/RimL family protein N-acetyltransferase
MLVDHFPLLGLRVRTPRLVLRLPTRRQLSDLADLAVEGVHDPEMMPFGVPWTQQSPADLARGVVVHHWATLGGWSTGNWSLPLTVLCDGVVVGQQSLAGKSFTVTRECSTGSWLGMRHHGRGIGTEMRAAIIHLAFAGLGAQEVVSSAFTDNPASLRVSSKLGYALDGVARYSVQDRLRVSQRLRLTSQAWREARQVAVSVEGLGACLPMFGLPAT